MDGGHRGPDAFHLLEWAVASGLSHAVRNIDWWAEPVDAAKNSAAAGQPQLLRFCLPALGCSLDGRQAKGDITNSVMSRLASTALSPHLPLLLLTVGPQLIGGFRHAGPMPEPE